MIVPEPILLPGAVAGFGRFERVGMVGERKVFEDELDLLAVPFAEFLEGPTDPPAEGSLEIGELDELHRRVGRTSHGVTRRRLNRLSGRLEEKPDCI